MFNNAVSRSHLPTQETRAIAQFFLKAVPDEAAALEEGRPVFRDVEHVRIMVAGDPKSQAEHKVRPEHIERFPEQYKAFKIGQEQRRQGMPIEEWPGLTASQVATFKACNVYTIEEFIELDDTALQRIGMGARKLQDKAKAYMAHAKDASAAQKYAEQVHDLKSVVASKDNQIAELARRLEEMEKRVFGGESVTETEERRGPGRPRKAVEG